MTVLRIDAVNMQRCLDCSAFRLVGNDYITMGRWSNPYAVDHHVMVTCEHLATRGPLPTIWVRLWPSRRAAFKERQWPW